MRWSLIIAAATPLVLATPVLAQSDPPAMQMPWPTSPPQTQAPDATEDTQADHSQMDHSQMGHGAEADDAVGDEPAPAAPTDHAAERFYSAEQMAAARRQLRREHGGAIVPNVMLDMAEIQFNDDETALHWEGEGWIGGDINRFVVKSEGEASEDDVERAEVQALYSRAVGPYFDLQAGLRYDIEPSPNRAYAVLGFEGVAPYWLRPLGHSSSPMKAN